MGRKRKRKRKRDGTLPLDLSTASHPKHFKPITSRLQPAHMQSKEMHQKAFPGNLGRSPGFGMMK